MHGGSVRKTQDIATLRDYRGILEGTSNLKFYVQVGSAVAIHLQRMINCIEEFQ